MAACATPQTERCEEDHTSEPERVLDTDLCTVPVRSWLLCTSDQLTMCSTGPVYVRRAVIAFSRRNGSGR